MALVGRSSAPSVPSAAEKRSCSAARSCGGRFAITAAVSESRTACTAAARAPLSRAATSFASVRKETASSYSMSEMSFPLASIALPYSSTATPTILDRRLAGPSWALSGNPAVEAISAPSKAVRTARDLIPNEIIGLFEPTLVAALYGVGWSGRIEHDHSAGCRGGMGQGYPDVRHAQLGRPVRRATVQREGGAVIGANHFDLSPADATCERVARKCLEGSLFCREAGSEMLGRQRARERVRLLVRLEQSAEPAFALRIEESFYARDVHEIDSHADDHGFACRQKDRRAGGTGDVVRAGSIAIQQRSASSNTRSTAQVQSRQRASRVALPLVRTCSAVSPNASSAAYRRSAYSSSSASRARRSGALSGYRSVASSPSNVVVAAVRRRGSNAASREAGSAKPSAARRAARRPAKKRSWSNPICPRRDPRPRMVRVNSGSASAVETICAPNGCSPACPV